MAIDKAILFLDRCKSGELLPYMLQRRKPQWLHFDHLTNLEERHPMRVDRDWLQNGPWFYLRQVWKIRQDAWCEDYVHHLR